MKNLRTLLIGTALSVTLLSGATGALAANHEDAFGHHVSTMARECGGVGSHIQEHHPDDTVGAHLQMMRLGGMDDGMTCGE